MLTFKEIGLEDRAVLEPMLLSLPYRVCDHSFASLYTWEKIYPAHWCVKDGTLYIFYPKCRLNTAYQIPFGGELARTVDIISRDAEERKIPLHFVSINEQMKNELEAACPGRFRFIEKRNYADYIYESEDLATYKGKKLHSKRNFVNRFESALGGRYTFEPVTAENTGEILDFNRKWDEEYGDDTDVSREAEAIARALESFDAIGMFGVVMRIDGKVAAYAMGSRLCEDTIDEQFEKAGSEPGAYQMITREFARRFGAGVRYINREEDMGLEGLRKSKLSYKPAFINMRYRAEEI